MARENSENLRLTKAADAKKDQGDTHQIFHDWFTAAFLLSLVAAKSAVRMAIAMYSLNCYLCCTGGGYTFCTQKSIHRASPRRLHFQYTLTAVFSANKFANKGGGLRKVAKRMRTVAAEMKDNLTTVRREDVALKPFEVPFSGEGMSELLTIGAVTARAGGELSTHTLKVRASQYMRSIPLPVMM